MKELKLNTIRFVNDDIMSTSCASTDLFEAYYEDDQTLIVVNVNKDEVYGKNINISPGYYHLIDGELVPCPTWNKNEDNWEEVFDAHGINKTILK